MCKYCDLDPYVGESMPFEIQVDGTKQEYDICILDDIDNEQFSIQIDGTYSDIRIGIKYCPMCGRNLNEL